MEVASVCRNTGKLCMYRRCCVSVEYKKITQVQRLHLVYDYRKAIWVQVLNLQVGIKESHVHVGTQGGSASLSFQKYRRTMQVTKASSVCSHVGTEQIHHLYLYVRTQENNVGTGTLHVGILEDQLGSEAAYVCRMKGKPRNVGAEVVSISLSVCRNPGAPFWYRSCICMQEYRKATQIQRYVQHSASVTLCRKT